MHTKSLLENPNGKDHLEDLDADERTIQKRILNKLDGKFCIGFIWFRTGTSVKYCILLKRVYGPQIYLPTFPVHSVLPDLIPLTISGERLIPWCSTLFEKPIVTQLVKKYPAFFMESEGSLPCSQKPATRLYPEPAESSSPHQSLSP
jgi:hypothetical protein